MAKRFGKFKFLLLGCLALFLFIAVLPLTALGQPSAVDSAIGGLDETAQKSQINTNVTANQIIGYLVNLILGFLGVLFLVLIIYGGIQWMTAGGNEDKVKKARELISHAAIGLGIILFAFLLTNFIIFKLLGITTSPIP